MQYSLTVMKSDCWTIISCQYGDQSYQNREAEYYIYTLSGNTYIITSSLVLQIVDGVRLLLCKRLANRFRPRHVILMKSSLDVIEESDKMFE